MCAAGGGDVKIESHRVSFREKAQSKVGSMDNVSHSPGGGNVKVRPRLVKTPLSVRTQPSYMYVFTHHDYQVLHRFDISDVITVQGGWVREVGQKPLNVFGELHY